MSIITDTIYARGSELSDRALKRIRERAGYREADEASLEWVRKSTPRTYTAHVGESVSHSDDSKEMDASDAAAALAEAIEWARESGGPDSDCEYSAVVWIVDQDGDIAGREDVTFSADGELED